MLLPSLLVTVAAIAPLVSATAYTCTNGGSFYCCADSGPFTGCVSATESVGCNYNEPYPVCCLDGGGQDCTFAQLADTCACPPVYTCAC